MRFSICSIVMLVLLLGGCAKTECEFPTEESPVWEEVTAPTTFLTEENPEIATENITADDTKDDAYLKYAEKYETAYRFADLYIPAKCWLIGNENIVEVFSVGGIDSVTVIEHRAMERVEHLNAGDFVNVSVFDKTGKSISIMLLPKDAEQLLGLIEEN